MDDGAISGGKRGRTDRAGSNSKCKNFNENINVDIYKLESGVTAAVLCCCVLAGAERAEGRVSVFP